MNIGFDLDDVICDTYPMIIREAQRYHKEVLKLKPCPIIEEESKGNYCHFAKKLGWTEDNLRNFYYDYYPFFLEKCEKIEGTINLIKKVKEMNNNIFIISAREQRKYYNVYELTMRWLINNGVPADYVAIDVKNKSEIIEKFNISVFVDDSYKNCVDISSRKNCSVYHNICKYNYLGVYQYNNFIKPLYSPIQLQEILEA